jgi:signal peptidase I
MAESWRRWLNELLDAVVVAGVTALLLINFVVRSFYIPSGSMEPTLAINDFILVNEFIYHLVRPHRGDIVVFRPVDGSKQDLIKRIIGLEGDVIEVREGKLYRNQQRIEESYIPEKIDRDFGPILVKPGKLFMMGDNRNSSFDSRYWGQLPLENVVGQAFMIFMNPREPSRIKLRWLPSDQGTPTVNL